MSNAASDIEGDADNIDFGELLGVIIENRWIIIAITCAAMIFGMYKAFVAVPVYRADALLQVEEKSTGLTNLEVSTMLQDYAPVNAEVEILQSRSVLGGVVENLNLDISAEPEFFSMFSAALARRVLPDERPMITVDTLEMPDSLRGAAMKLVASGGDRYQLFDEGGTSLGQGVVGEVAKIDFDDNDNEHITVFVSALQAQPNRVFWIQKLSRAVSIGQLQDGLNVTERAEWSGILSITVEGDDPSSVQQQVNEIANVYVQKNVERKSAEAQKTLEFLDEQIPIVQQNMEASELALNTYRLEKGSIDLPLETQTLLQTIVSIEAQLNQIRQEREKVMQTFTQAHPTIATLDRQMGRVISELSDLNEQVHDLPTTQQELLRLLRDVEVTTALYRSLLDTAQELRVVTAGMIGNVRVIDYALKPNYPIRPNRSRILIMYLVAGLFVSVALAFAKKALKTGVEDPDMIARHINVPVYATISHSKRQDRLFRDLKSKTSSDAILAVDTPDDSAIESLRNLRTALHFGMMDVKNNCIMIAGPSPSVGKSFVSVNLAAVLTSNEKKVLLIDADMRRGHLHEYLGVERANGLSEFISGEAAIGEVLHDTPITGLTLIPTGTMPPNPAELLLHQRFGGCLSELMPRYDHIIIDSPPILAATDATIIGQAVGGTLMVLKSGEHPIREIDQAVKRLQQAQVNLRGILFNDVKIGSQNYGSGRYHYQYTY